MESGSAVHSTGNDDWRTPLWLYKRLDQDFHFGLDAAATDENALAPAWFTAEDNALKHSWRGYGNVFCNPPYSRVLNRDFVKHAVDQLDGTFYISMLLVSKTSVPWWHDDVLPVAEAIGFVRGRLKFQGAKIGAPFPSCVVVFKSPRRENPMMPKIFSIYQPEDSENE